jgi:hypothetical protein
MTTVAQVKQVVQPLLQSNPDLALVGRMIVVKPVHHLLRGVYLARSSDPDDFVPTERLAPCFNPKKESDSAGAAGFTRLMASGISTMQA